MNRPGARRQGAMIEHDEPQGVIRSMQLEDVTGLISTQCIHTDGKPTKENAPFLYICITERATRLLAQRCDRIQ
jgi:hypothetical protein